VQQAILTFSEDRPKPLLIKQLIGKSNWPQICWQI